MLSDIAALVALVAVGNVAAAPLSIATPATSVTFAALVGFSDTVAHSGSHPKRSCRCWARRRSSTKHAIEHVIIAFSAEP